jgi:AsmA protein
LKGLNAAGKLKIGKLSAFNLKAADVRAEIKLSNARVTAAPLSAQLYQGTTNGSISASAGAMPVFTVRQTLWGVSVGPLLHDAAQIDSLEAKGNVTLDVTAQGATVDALKKSLSGTASVNLADGAIRGFDVAATLRTAKARLRELRGEHVQQTNIAQKTDFSELKATLKIKDGIARNDDLAIKSPLLRLGGAGDLDIGADRISYLLKATVVATSKGQGGKDLAELNGLMVPVKLTGALDRPQYSIDFTGMVVDLARREVQDELLRRATGQISTSSIRERVIKGIIAR